jgi:hypothetical protein
MSTLTTAKPAGLQLIELISFAHPRVSRGHEWRGPVHTLFTR